MAICTHMQNSWQIIKAGLPLPRQMCHAVIAIRQSKLPDPKVLANCGSFFFKTQSSQQNIIKTVRRLS